MLKLHFDQAAISRSTSREEWYKLWRWKRVVEKQLARSIEERIRLLQVYGTDMPEYMRKDMIEELINPPLLVR